MAVLPMKRIEIIALRRDRKAILEELQRKGVLEITDIESEENDIFKREDITMAADAFARNISQAKNAIEILDKYAPEKTSLLASLNGRIEKTAADYEEFDRKRDVAEKYVARINNLAKVISESKAETLKYQTQIEALSPWAGLDVPLGFSGTKKTAVFIGTLPGVWNADQITEALAAVTPVDADVISVVKDVTCVYIMTTIEKQEEAYEILRAQGFARPAIPGALVPKDQQKEYEEKLKKLSEDAVKAAEDIKGLADKRETVKFYLDYETMRRDKYDVINRLLSSDHAFVLEGYAAERDVEALKSALESKYDLSFEAVTPGEDEKVPILLKNNGFSAPLESITESYSMPGKGELDPTFSVSLFYYILFGLMFSDAGYGLILVVATSIALLKFKNMEKSMKMFCRMFLFCGLSTTFWGIIFGSYFGDVFASVATNFFGSDFNIGPVWFNPSDNPMQMLVFCMIIGLIHLIAGLIMKFIVCMKNHKVIDALCDGLLWVMLLIGLVLFAMSSEMFMGIIQIDFVLTGTPAEIGKWLTIVSAGLVVITGIRKSKNPGVGIALGAYDLYGVTSYLSDMLSYSRLLALGLATGIIGTVINQMAGMAGSGFVKVIIYVVIFIVGHLLNFLINILGAYVHTNRLQYVEFFGKFYEGGGRAFSPFAVKTKYYKIKEN